MEHKDEVAAVNERHWDWAVRKGAGCTIPWLDLDPVLLRRYAKGELEPVPERLRDVMPELAGVLAGLAGRDVLCLAAGGGQQSAVFGLLGARVTVVDLCEGQLEGDRKAAAHYGYPVTTFQADMRDLSCLQDNTFDLVYGTGSCFIPDLAPVFAGVARVLRPSGLYRADFANPATEFVEPDTWDGEGYRITLPYAVKKRMDPPDDDGEPSVQFRHYLDEIFNGLLDAGFSIQRVHEPWRRHQPDPDARPGTWKHCGAYTAGLCILARKGQRTSQQPCGGDAEARAPRP